MATLPSRRRVNERPIPRTSSAILRAAVALGCLLSGGAVAVRAAQAPAVQSAAPAEAKPSTPDAVVDYYRQEITLETDGRVTAEIVQRVKVNTDDGVTEAGTIALPYARDAHTLLVHYVRVRKADGRVVDTPLTDVIDVQAAVTRAAPTYTDAYERRINVRGLAVGDTIEFAYRLEQRPLIPGQFAAEDDWLLGDVVRDGEVSLSVPASMPIAVKTRGTQPVQTTAGSRRVYRWTVNRPTEMTMADLNALAIERRTERPAIQISTYRSWAQLGDAMRELWRGRAAVTPEIREKADALTKGLTADSAKVEALYRFVSRDIRYIAVLFGAGRYQPHAASEVLANGFGDCKDKHVLLEALLRAVGIESSPVLLSPGQSLDAEVPSPVQFTHVITEVQLASGPMWLDATLQEAPAGHLVGAERDHQALRVPQTGDAALVRTPAQPVRPDAFTGPDSPEVRAADAAARAAAAKADAEAAAVCQVRME